MAVFQSQVIQGDNNSLSSLAMSIANRNAAARQNAIGNVFQGIGAAAEVGQLARGIGQDNAERAKNRFTSGIAELQDKGTNPATNAFSHEYLAAKALNDLGVLRSMRDHTRYACTGSYDKRADGENTDAYFEKFFPGAKNNPMIRKLRSAFDATMDDSDKTVFGELYQQAQNPLVQEYLGAMSRAVTNEAPGGAELTQANRQQVPATPAQPLTPSNVPLTSQQLNVLSFEQPEGTVAPAATAPTMSAQGPVPGGAPAQLPATAIPVSAPMYAASATPVAASAAPVAASTAPGAATPAVAPKTAPVFDNPLGAAKPASVGALPSSADGVGFAVLAGVSPGAKTSFGSKPDQVQTNIKSTAMGVLSKMSGVAPTAVATAFNQFTEGFSGTPDSKALAVAKAVLKGITGADVPDAEVASKFTRLRSGAINSVNGHLDRTLEYDVDRMGNNARVLYIPIDKVGAEPASAKSASITPNADHAVNRALSQSPVPAATTIQLKASQTPEGWTKLGTTPEAAYKLNTKIMNGQPLDEEDVDTMNKVTRIGPRVYRELDDAKLASGVTWKDFKDAFPSSAAEREKIYKKLNGFDVTFEDFMRGDDTPLDYTDKLSKLQQAYIKRDDASQTMLAAAANTREAIARAGFDVTETGAIMRDPSVIAESEFKMKKEGFDMAIAERRLRVEELNAETAQRKFDQALSGESPEDATTNASLLNWSSNFGSNLMQYYYQLHPDQAGRFDKTMFDEWCKEPAQADQLKLRDRVNKKLLNVDTKTTPTTIRVSAQLFNPFGNMFGGGEQQQQQQQQQQLSNSATNYLSTLKPAPEPR